MEDGRIQHWMAQALALAQNAASQDETPVGAVLVIGDQMIAQSGNTREKSSRVLGHAELNCLETFNRSGSWRLPPEACLFVTVEPCLMCTGAMIASRLSHLYFGCRDSKNAGLSRILPLINSGVFDHRFATVRGGVLESKCSSILSQYFQDKRKPNPTPTQS